MSALEEQSSDERIDKENLKMRKKGEKVKKREVNMKIKHKVECELNAACECEVQEEEQEDKCDEIDNGKFRYEVCMVCRLPEEMMKERYGWSALNVSIGSMLNASQQTTSLNSVVITSLVLHVFMERERNEVLSVLCVLIIFRTIIMIVKKIQCLYDEEGGGGGGSIMKRQNDVIFFKVVWRCPFNEISQFFRRGKC